MRRNRTHGIPHRLTAALLCLCMIASMIGSVGVTTAFAVNPGPTEKIVAGTRVADPDTMDDYLNRLLTDLSGSRYAGRVWTDKTVFAYGYDNGDAKDHFNGKNTITLNMATDGYDGAVSFNSDFAHVFSALASSQMVNEYPPSPVDLVIVFDMSGSMGQDTRFGIDTGLNIYMEHNGANDGTNKWPDVGVPMADRIANSRIQITLNAINNTIDKLMEQNPQNRVAVCGYGANAVVLMPLGHYQRVNGAPYLSVGGMETLYHPSDLVYRKPDEEVKKGDTPLPTVTEEGWYWMNNRDTCYTVVVNAEYNTYTGILNENGDGKGQEGAKPNTTDEWTKLTKTVSNNVLSDDGEQVKAFPGAWDADGKTPQDTYATLSKTIYEGSSSDANKWSGGANGYINGQELRKAFENQEAVGLKADDYVGYFTNTQGGIYLAYKQLADSEATTYTETLSNGVVSTVARIPAAIIMSDGGANFSFNEMGNDSQEYTAADWNVRYGQRQTGDNYLNYINDDNYTNSNTSAAWKDADNRVDGHDLDYKHRLGSDEYHSGNLGNEWYKVFIPGEDTLIGWDGLHGIYNQGADIFEDGTLSTPPYWNHAGVLYSSDNSPVDAPGTILEVLLTAAYMHDVVKTHYNNGWTTDGATEESRSDLFTYTMNVDTEHVPQWGKMRLYPTLDPKEYPLDTIKSEQWYKKTEKFGEENLTNESTLTSVYEDLYNSWNNWKSDGKTEATIANGNNAKITINSIESAGANAADYQTQLTTKDGKTQDDTIQVTDNDVVNNIAYNDGFYDVTSTDLSNTFEEILTLILGNVFVPVSGDNDAGVGDSITYQDPIGEHMEIKNGSITAKTHKDTTEKIYDMALLLFGEMHGLVRTGVYDYQWNDAWMHKTGGAGVAAFTEGWYLGDDPTTAKSGGSDAVPTGSDVGPYTSADEAWADGWVYRLNFKTASQFIPILGNIKSPDEIPEQMRNTVYTMYRFAGDAKDRNALRRNPIYGEGVPQAYLDTWAEFEESGEYPETLEEANIDTKEYPGIYRLSDIRVWVEDTGDFVDTDGAITPNSGYDRSLYVNIPSAAIPTELATITLGRDGVLSYETNLGSDHPEGSQIVVEQDGKEVEKTVDEAMYKNFCAQSTPFRLFYAVGLEEDLILRDEDGNQTGVDFNAISPEYLQSHTDPETNYVWFISNFYSNTMYGDYATDDISRTRGDPTVTFSPSSDNRYYVFQKPLPLYAHAYRWDGSELKPVDGEGFDANKGGNGKTTWEGGATGGANWAGGQYMGTYENEAAFTSAKSAMTDGKTITDSNGIKYEYVENGIVFLQEDMLTDVTSVSDTEYAEGAKSFSSDDYYFILLEFYVPYPDTIGKDNENEDVPGTYGGHMVQYAITRKGSEFGSGYNSPYINNGDMLCWTDTNNKLNIEFEYLSRTDTGDNTRGEPTWEKLTKTGDDLEKALEDCGIDPEEDIIVKDEDGTPTKFTVKDYWLKMQDDPLVQAALKAADTDGVEGLSENEFKAAFKFAVAARPGGVRSGDMSSNLQYKGTSYDGTTQLYNDNVTKTSNTYYLPTVSDHSGTGDQVIINNYLGNNGRLEIANQSLHVTKLLQAPEGFELTAAQKNETFNYQIFVQGVTGKRTAVRTEYNEYSGTWERRLAYIDVLTDNSDLVLTIDSTRALFVLETSGDTNTAKQVVQGEEDGKPVYYYANEDGTQGEKVDSPTLYYLYLPHNGNTEEAQHTRRLYQDSAYDGSADGYDAGSKDFENNGVTTFDEDADHPAGTRTYWATDAELIPVSEVQATENRAGDEGGDGPTTYALESVSGGVWTHGTDEENHKKLASQTLLTRKPNDETSEAGLTSPFLTRSQYMTVELIFGKNANEDDGSTTDELTVGDLYDGIIPSGDRPDLFGSLDAKQIAASTAEFTLKHGEGLLLTGLDNRIPYRFTEKLTEAQLAKGYTLQEISHVQQRGSDSIYRPGTQEIPVWTKEGATYGEKYGTEAADKLTENGLTWAGAPDATENKEPFAHTNAVMWEYYATMAKDASGNHHQPTGVSPEVESSIQVWTEGTKNTYDTVEKSHTVSDNPNCTEWNSETKTGCDVPQEDGSVLHYMYRDGVLIDPHYEGEASTYLRNMARYGVSPTVHFGVSGETTEAMKGSTDYTGVYSVFGNTGWFEEQVNYVNTFEPGAISITKKLASESGTTVTEADKNSEFSFTLTLNTEKGIGKSDGIYDYTVTDETRAEVKHGRLVPHGYPDSTKSANDIKAKEDGNWDFTLQGGQTMTVTGLTVNSGYTYEIQEDSYPGYSVQDSDTGTKTDGAVTGKVPAKSSEPVQVTFTNTKKSPEPAKVNLKLKKEVTGEGFTWADHEFTFLVTPDPTNPEGDPIEGVHTVDVTSTAAVAVFDGVEFKVPGTYKYTVSEQPSSIPGISTDGKTYAVVVTVSEEYDASGIYTGKLKAEITVDGEKKENDTVAVTFTNTYDKTKITVPFNAKKVLKGGTLTAGQFSFELREGDTVLQTVKNDADGNINFKPQTFETEGNHTYTIREVAGGETGITYDNTVYTVTVKIEKDGDALKSTVTYESDKASGDVTGIPTFINEVKPGSLRVVKRVTGAGDREQEFSFTVTFTPAAGLDGVTVTKNGEAESTLKIENGKLTFTLKDGEYVDVTGLPDGTKYTVTEAPAEGYTTTISPGDSGTIKAGETDTVTVTNDKPDNPPPPPEEPTGSLTVHKTVTGGGEEAAGKVYTFDVTGPDGYSETLTVTGSGSATLTDLVPGEYTVTERDAEIEGYELTVTGGGNVTVTADTAAEVTVTNTYTEERKGSLTVTKAVAGEGEALEDKEFTFTVTGPDGYAESFTLKNGESKTLTDLTPGAYTVAEADASVEGYTLETTGTGGVEVTAETPAEVTVTNIYTEEGKGSLTVTKAVAGEGEALEDKEFTFTVTGPDDFTESFTLKNGESKTLTDLTPGAYTVTEADASVEGYTLETTGTGGVEVTAETPAEVTVTNIYTEEGKGSLTVTKTVVGGGEEAANKTYTFDVTGPNGYSETLTVTGSGSATLTDLVPGEYTVTERDAQIEGCKLTVTGGGSVAVAADTAAQAAFTNTYYKTGDLTVTKTVTGGAGDRSRYFTFTVTLSESLTGTYGGMTFTEGVATFHLKDGDSRTATGLPAGIGYTVTEAEADRGGYETAATGDSGVIPEDGTARADFVNRKELPPPPEPGEGDLTITKTVSGNATSNMTPFHFTVTLDDTSINGDYGDMTFTNGVAEFMLRHGQSRTATGLPAGTGYTVTEAEADREGYQTTATGDAGTIPDGGAAEAAFDNYRNVTVEEPKPGPLAVRKLVTGEGGDTEQEFTFRVTLDTPLNGTYGDMEFVDGVAEFTLKSDEVKWGRNIPVGTAFTVEELEANEDGYDTIAEGAVGVIQNEVRSEVRFHNHRGLWEPEDDEPWEELEDPEIPLSFLPKTGDDTHLGLWAALLLLSAIGTAAASLTLIRAKRRLVSGKGKHLKKD